MCTPAFGQLRGDVNNDQVINILDADLAVQFILADEGVIPPGAVSFEALVHGSS